MSILGHATLHTAGVAVCNGAAARGNGTMSMLSPQVETQVIIDWTESVMRR